MVRFVSLTNLQQLQAGHLTSAYRKSQQLEPVTRLQISAQLTQFPTEIFDLADCLEILDLSHNQLSELPNDLDRLVNMRILFLSSNNFQRIPAVLAACPKLEMISFKSNDLTQVDENVLPVDTRWLILTDNHIASLPDSMGQLHRLQKLALAGNRLTQLPDSMSNCRNLELVRLSANDLMAMPDWIFQLPKLAWLAFSGNAFNRAEILESAPTVTEVPLENIKLGEVLGEGASGLIYQGEWITQPKGMRHSAASIAVKIFKGAVTSDGYPQDEVDCCLLAGEHENLIKVLAQLDQGHIDRDDTEKRLGLVMELIPKSFYNLGLPPSLHSCTRDTFTMGTEFSLELIAKIALQMADVMAHLHKIGISHGDVYAHNTLINDQGDMLFGDFGAATPLALLPPLQTEAMEKIEVRAFANLLDDLLQLSSIESQDCPLYRELSAIRDNGLRDTLAERFSFLEIHSKLSAQN